MKSNMHGPVLRWLAASLLAISMLAGCGGGGSDPAITTPVAAAPQPAILFGGAVAAAVAGADATGSMGGLIELDAGGSKDVDGNALSFAWSIVSKPAGSNLSLNAASAAKLSFQADVLGSYVFKLRVTNSKGGSAEKNATVLINNTVPNVAVVVNATYEATPVVKPALNVYAGSSIVLDASGSTDADGDVVATTWELFEKPQGSTAALVVTGQTARFSADLLGLYKVRARGADGKGGYAETVYQLNAATKAPTNVIRGVVAVISRDNQSVPVGQPVVTSGILSYDEGGAKLSYSWAVDSRPAGSVAVLAAATTYLPSFTPDVAGAYVLSLTVNNGRQTAVAYLTLNAYASTSSVVALPFAPLEARYNQALDRLVVVAANPDALKIINPADGTITSISLPNSVKSFNLSPDGKLAAVLHEGVVSLVDLVAGQLVNSTGTAGSQTEVFVTNDGLTFLTGQSIGTSRSNVNVLNARTGQFLPGLDYFSGAYGNVRGVFSAIKNKAFVMQVGSSYAPSTFTIDPKTGAILSSAYGNYGDYPVNAPLFLSAKEDLVFTSSGTYFDSETLKYVGRFVLNNSLLSMSHSAVKSEALVMEASNNYPGFYNDPSYQDSYRRYSGDLLFPAGTVALPVIGGEASYGIGIFHTVAGDPVALVQTGGALKSTARAKYYLIYR